MTRKWITTQGNERTNRVRRDINVHVEGVKVVPGSFAVEIDYGPSGQVSERSLAGVVGPSVSPAMMQFKGFRKGSGSISLMSLSFRRIFTLVYDFTEMTSSFPSMAPSIARVFAPSLRCQSQKSSLPILRRSFATPTEQPRLRLGSVAPNFKAKTTQGDIDFHEWLGDKWGILFSHPADFTPVCTTELGAFAKMKDEFEKRHVKMIGLVRTEHSLSQMVYIELTVLISLLTISDRMTDG